MSVPFLQRVALAYASSPPPNWEDICFVFPNKRSATFFARYLGGELQDSTIGPAMMTMAEWLEFFDDQVIASRYEELFILYDVYRQLAPELAIQGFDQFRFWGEMLLHDFADIDKSLADAEKLLSNVERQKEIQSDYLTEEQKEVIRLFWGDTYAKYRLTGRMWRHLEDVDDDTAEGKYLSLWNVLGKLYTSFNNRLDKLGLTTSGRRLRKVSKNLSSVDTVNLPFAKSVFVGFFDLSVAELKIFKNLKRVEAADFYWDVPSLMSIISDSASWTFINHCASNFPSRYDIDTSNDVNQECKIEIIGSPSSTGQIRIASNRLLQWIEGKTISNVKNALDTAVVLPDESHLIDMMSLIPDEFETLNVSIGIGLRVTPVAALMRDIVGLQLNVRNVKDQVSFYRDSVIKLISNPLLHSLFPEECECIKREIGSSRDYNISISDIVNLCPAFDSFFQRLESQKDIVTYINDVLSLVKEKSGDSVTGSVCRLYCEAYLSELNKLYNTIGSYRIEMGALTFLQMIERTINSSTIHFKGEPLKGLQVVGMLETRALDFDNLIILSMNEKIYPRKYNTASFIPENIRHGYGLPTRINQEAVATYNFYRLLSRAKNVCLIYDSRTVGTSCGDMSRYLIQLLYLRPKRTKLSHSQYNFSQSRIEKRDLSIEKDEQVVEMLGRYLSQVDGAPHLSASALNDFVGCPVKFFINDVAKISLEEDDGLSLDAGSYGTIVHNALQRIYINAGERIVTKTILNSWINEPFLHIAPHVTRAINYVWHDRRTANELDEPLEGETKILAYLIVKVVTKVLEREIPFTPFKILGTEVSDTIAIDLGGKIVNFRYIIDRIDRANLNPDGSGGVMRIIDYKTGSSTNATFSSVEELFESHTDNKAVRQLLLYCMLYRMKNKIPLDDPIKPYIYKLANVFKDAFTPLKYQDSPVDNDLDYADEFRKCLTKTIDEMFSTEGQNAFFTASENDDYCKYCSLKNVCNRTSKEY